MTESQDNGARRPLKTRGMAWAQALARLLASMRISPNMLSVMSIFFALGGAACAAGTFYCDCDLILFIGFACCIQLRLLVNMLDGMVAVEGGLGGPTGDIYNEFPDRIADAIFIVAAAYIAATSQWPYGLEIGWAACALYC